MKDYAQAYSCNNTYDGIAKDMPHVTLLSF